MRTSTRFATVGAFAMLILTSGTAAGAEPAGNGLVRVSQRSPFADCTDRRHTDLDAVSRR